MKAIQADITTREPETKPRFRAGRTNAERVAVLAASFAGRQAGFR